MNFKVNISHAESLQIYTTVNQLSFAQLFHDAFDHDLMEHAFKLFAIGMQELMLISRSESQVMEIWNWIEIAHDSLKRCVGKIMRSYYGFQNI